MLEDELSEEGRFAAERETRHLSVKIEPSLQLSFMIAAGPSGCEEVISLQKVDSLLVSLKIRELKRFLRHNAEGFG